MEERQNHELAEPDKVVRRKWKKEQRRLKKLMVCEDVYDMEFLTSTGENRLKYIAGVDISFIKGDEVNACACLVVCSFPELEVVYETFQMVQLTEPYIPGFLAFREVPHLLPLFEKLKADMPDVYPQILLVDGNGFLHPRGFGLACHLGVLSDIPTIGIGKTFLFVDGMKLRGIKELFKEKCTKGGDWVELIGNSGTVWGAAFQASDESTNPIFVSTGHKFTLNMAVEVIRVCCKFRVPEPVRQADLRSRDYLRNHPL